MCAKPRELERIPDNVPAQDRDKPWKWLGRWVRPTWGNQLIYIMPKLLDYDHVSKHSRTWHEVDECGKRFLERAHLLECVERGRIDLLGYARFSPDSINGQMPRIPTVDDMVEFLWNMGALELVDRETYGLPALKEDDIEKFRASLERRAKNAIDYGVYVALLISGDRPGGWSP